MGAVLVLDFCSRCRLRTLGVKVRNRCLVSCTGVGELPFGEVFRNNIFVGKTFQRLYPFTG